MSIWRIFKSMLATNTRTMQIEANHTIEANHHVHCPLNVKAMMRDSHGKKFTELIYFIELTFIDVTVNKYAFPLGPYKLLSPMTINVSNWASLVHGL